MKTFTIDEQNNISWFASQAEAVAVSSTPFDTFSNKNEFSSLASAWPMERLIGIWNSLPGVEPVKQFTSPNAAINKIWQRVGVLGQSAKPKTQAKADTAKRRAKGAPNRRKAGKKASRANVASKAKNSTKVEGDTGPREGSKAAKVISMLQRKNGVTLSEIMDTMGWQKHTVRGFIAGSMKKAGYKIESFKPEGGERTYRLL